MLQKHQATWLAAQHALLFIDYQSGFVIPAISRNGMYAVDLIQRFMVEPLIRCTESWWMPLATKKLKSSTSSRVRCAYKVQYIQLVMGSIAIGSL